MSAKSADYFNRNISEEQILEMKKQVFAFEKPIPCVDCEGKGYKSFVSFRCSKCGGSGLIK